MNGGGGTLALQLALGLLPVCLFLIGLIYLDSYKLVRLRTILEMIAAGGVAAGISYAINRLVFADLPGGQRALTIFAAPLVEEIVKAVPVIVMIRLKRVGFLVDAAIFGFAVGAGFSLVENVYYFTALPASSPALWLVRGFGTAIMHGVSTAIVALIAKLITNRSERSSWFALAGLAVAYAVHALFNSFLLPPLISALALIVIFPPLLVIVFAQSERYLRAWLGSGFDLDAELLDAMQSGSFHDSPAGEFLRSLREHFDGPVLADMLCLVRLHAELALRAKGILMMRESGFAVPHDPEIDEKLGELAYLTRSIGKTGERAIAPIIHSSAEDVWQLRVLTSG